MGRGLEDLLEWGVMEVDWETVRVPPRPTTSILGVPCAFEGVLDPDLVKVPLAEEHGVRDVERVREFEGVEVEVREKTGHREGEEVLVFEGTLVPVEVCELD